MIDITGVDLREFIRAVYDLSAPRGLGFIHATKGPLDDESINEIFTNPFLPETIKVRMDYVHGRSCKMTVRKNSETGGLEIADSWYDHSDAQLKELLRRVGK